MKILLNLWNQPISKVCTTSELCQFEGISCMGCCGHTYDGKTEVKESVKRNTLSYKHLTKEPDNLRRWRDRSRFLHTSGACYNLVYLDKDKKKVGCALHPANHKGKDLRENYCERNYLCPTAKKFAKWNEKQKEKFRKFLREKMKKGDWYDYSMGMDSGKYLKEFEKIKKKQELFLQAHERYDN